MRTLIFATYGLIVALATPAFGATDSVVIKGHTNDGAPCSVSFQVNTNNLDPMKKNTVTSFVVKAGEMERYSGEFMSVERHELAGPLRISFTREQLKSFSYVTDSRAGITNGSLIRGVITDANGEKTQVRLRVSYGKWRSFTFSSRSGGSKFVDETLLTCSDQD